MFTRDKYRVVLAYIISSRKNLLDRYWEWRKDDSRMLKDLWGGLSHGETLLMQTAIFLFQGQGRIDISEVCSVLDHDSFFVFVQGLELYRQ